MRRISVVLMAIFMMTACNSTPDAKTLDKGIAQIKQENQAKKQEIISLQAENLKKYKQATNVNLINRDVEFDLENNIDKKFIIQGNASLSNYYNYGYRDLEKDEFCIKVIPYDNSAAWYMYVPREAENGKKLFNKLKELGNVDLIGVANIPTAYYQKGQGNMALLVQVIY